MSNNTYSSEISGTRTIYFINDVKKYTGFCIFSTHRSIYRIAIQIVESLHFGCQVQTLSGLDVVKNKQKSQHQHLKISTVSASTLIFIQKILAVTYVTYIMVLALCETLPHNFPGSIVKLGTQWICNT